MLLVGAGPCREMGPVRGIGFAAACCRCMINFVCGREIGVADWCLPVGVGAETRKKCLREKEQNDGDREQKGRDKEQFCSNF